MIYRVYGRCACVLQRQRKREMLKNADCLCQCVCGCERVFFSDCSRTLSLSVPCLTRTLQSCALPLPPPPPATRTHAPTPTPTECCHTQQKPPKLILTRSRPAHQPTKHTIGIIDQSLTFWWKQGREKRAAESFPFLSFQQTFLSHHKFVYWPPSSPLWHTI